VKVSPTPCLWVLGLNLLQDRKFFDSADFALSKATDDSITGHQKTGKDYPRLGNVVHLSSPVPSYGRVKIDADTSRNPTTADPMRAAPLSPLAGYQSRKGEIGQSAKNGMCSTGNQVGRNQH